MMRLSPLQSRLAASVAASCLLLLLYLVLFPPNFALAAELDRPSTNVGIDELNFSINPAVRGLLDPTYEARFVDFEPSITGRAADVIPLANNEPTPMNIDQGTTMPYVFVLPGGMGRSRMELRSESDDAGAGVGVTDDGDRDDTNPHDSERSLRTRQESRTVYLSANTCLQPQPVDPSKTQSEPPQLELYVSTSPDNKTPGPLADGKTQKKVVFKQGAVVFNISVSDDVYIGIYAPDTGDQFSGQYNVRLAASVDSLYYTYNDRDDADLLWVDSDSQGALLRTQNLTQSTDQSYVLFAHNKKDRAINGLKYSFCGLQNYAQIAAMRDGRHNTMVRTSMTKRQGNVPQQQFFFSGLNASADYIGILAKDGEDHGNLERRQSGVMRGSEVFRQTNFSTKSDHGNCALIIDLDFCDQVAYSVPSNPKFGNTTKLADFYDKYASSFYANFNKSLAQVACEAPSSQRYSLARNCTDCATAYKDWLCSVTIPRCEDFSNTASYLQERAIDQPFPNGDKLDPKIRAVLPNTPTYLTSRNPQIDEIIKPGPYKELLPCDDLCYKLVQSCPASMQFGCPVPGQVGFQGNYVKHDPSAGLTCNFPGSAHFPSAGRKGVSLSLGYMGGMVVGVVGLLML
ncbi:stretch-activated Ca2+-permeable channel component-domain-containing protein [Chaetomium sp. MPI-SDFR-AT-0129]|nr:stretch-activated Ca2+-permeable channel component-domain-containing protein [Chaetomium sp. MPI-SDFR-AT-0129]